MFENIEKTLMQKEKMIDVIKKYLGNNNDKRKEIAKEHKKIIDGAFLSFGFHRRKLEDKEFVERVGFYLEGVKQNFNS